VTKEEEEDRPIIVYSAPISLCDSLPSSLLSLSVEGVNRGAKFDPITKLFRIQNVIILAINTSLKYQFYEYHFHMPGDHELCGKRYPAELHYSLVKLEEGESHVEEEIPGDRNIAGLARVVKGEVRRRI